MSAEPSHSVGEGYVSSADASSSHAAPAINNGFNFLGPAAASSNEPKEYDNISEIPTSYAPGSDTTFSDKHQLSTSGATTDNASDHKDNVPEYDATAGSTKKATEEPDSATESVWRARFNRFMIWFKGRSDEEFQLKVQAQLKEQLGRDPSPFRFKPGELCSLIDPENMEQLQEMGGLNGLTSGLGTDVTRGINTDESGGAVRSGAGNYGTVADREHVYGRNVLPERKPKNLLLLMWTALQDKILILLIVAAIVSLALGIYTDATNHEEVPCETGYCEPPRVDFVEGLAIMVAVIIVDLVGSLNDWQKERQFRTLDAKKEARDVTVIRNGSETLLNVHDVVVGDIVRFEPGEVLAFDGVLVRGYNVKCDESSVTGESDMIVKYTYDDAVSISAKDKETSGKLNKRRSCFMISGSKVIEGIGDVVVTAVGPLCFNGKLMMSLRREPENTPLQSKLNVMADWIARLGSAAGLLLFIALMIRFFVELGENKRHHNPPKTPEGEPRNDDGNYYAERFIDILVICVTIVVVAVPEGLPLAVTLALAFATRRMSNNNLLVRVLSSCETMANATVICTDKTGTLTQNKMNVVAGCIGTNWRFQDAIKFEIEGGAHEQEHLERLQDIPDGIPQSIQDLLNDSICINSTAFVPEHVEESAVASKETSRFFGLEKYLPFLRKKSESTPNSDGESDAFMGSKTETALLTMARDMGWQNYKTVRDSAKIVQLVPFSSERKAMGVVVALPDGCYRLYSKGASEVLLGQSSNVVSFSKGVLSTAPLGDSEKGEMMGIITGFANQSLRTISLCFRDFSQWPPPNAPVVNENEVDYAFLAQDLTLIAITAIEDPLRHGVPEAVRACGRAGVQVKMCTGDNIITAKSIATQCGIYTPGGIVIEGPAFRRLSDEDLTFIAPRLQVLARSSPEDKKKLTEKLKSLDGIVAVTGDGTNDGPALKAANVGFSMGIAGSEVAKEASDIILMDDNFASIVRAIMWGRCVNDAVRKFLQFQITVNVVAVVVTFVSAVSSAEQKSVLTAVQLLWLNLIMDTLAALALATDPADESSLDRKPGNINAPLVTTEMWMHIAVQSIYQIIVVLVLVYRADDILNLTKGDERYTKQDELDFLHDQREKNSLIFNVFVWCQLFNQINARRLDRGLNIFHKIHRNVWFLLIVCIEAGAQVLIIFKGSYAFSVQPINGRDWGISLIAGLVSWPLGAFTRMIPVEWVERMLVTLRIKRSHNVPVTNDTEDVTVLEWSEPAIGAVAERLNHFSRIRGGRLRASNMVLKTKSQQMKDKDVHPHSLMALVPTLIGASLGGVWRPTAHDGEDHPDPPIPIKTLYEQGRITVHPDTAPDEQVFQYIKNGGLKA